MPSQGLETTSSIQAFIALRLFLRALFTSENRVHITLSSTKTIRKRFGIKAFFGENHASSRSMMYLKF